MRFTVYKYGEVFKLVHCFSCPDVEKRSHKKKEEEQDEEASSFGKLDNNLCRAKSTVKELILCNRWEYFVTLTLDKSKVDRYSKDVYTQITQWIRDMRKKYSVPFRYVMVCEQHKDGAFHWHGVLSGVAPLLARNENGFLEIPEYRRRFGFCSVLPIAKESPRIATYISKYITKDSASLCTNNHTFMASHKLARRCKLGTIALDDTIVREKHFYMNDYCVTAWVDSQAELLNLAEVEQ